MSADAATLGWPDIQRWQRGSLVAGLLGLLLCVPGAVWGREQFFRSYLWAFMAVLGVALGCLVVLMVQYLTGGGWGLALRRILEAATRTLPALAVFFLPLLAGLPDLYLWARPDIVAEDRGLQHKAAYLNVNFFMARAAVYFAVWIVLALVLNFLSRRQDALGGRDDGTTIRKVSAVGLGLYGATITFASIDWVMSLEPHWYSSIFGVLVGVGQLLTGFAFAVVVALTVGDRPPLSGFMTATHRHDFGKLLLAFIMVWAYISFSQFLLIWSGNLPEEITWYLERFQAGWQWLGLSLVLFQFFLPFALLLSRNLKRDPRALRSVAVFILVMRLVDLYWLISPAPAVSPSNQPASAAFLIALTDIAALVGLGGLWLAFFLWQLQRRPLLPTYDPDLTPEAASHE